MLWQKLLVSPMFGQDGGCSGVQYPDQGGAFKDQAGLDPSQVRRPEGAKRCAWKAEPEDAGERQAREQNPVVVTTPPDAWDGKLQQQRAEDRKSTRLNSSHY